MSNLGEMMTTACGTCGTTAEVDDRMIGCKNCSSWYHMQCISTVQVRCSEYLVDNQKRKRKIRKRNKELGYESDRSSKSARSNNDVSSELEKRMEKLEEEKQEKEREIEIEMIVLGKRMEMERALEEKKLKLKNAIRAKQREEEKVLLEKVFADEKNHLEELKKMRDSFEVKMCSIQKEVPQLKMSVRGNQKKEEDLRTPFRKPKVTVAKKIKKKEAAKKAMMPRQLEDWEGSEEESDGAEEEREDVVSDGESEEEYEEDIDEDTEEEQVKKKIPKPDVKKTIANGLGQRCSVPTKAQMAARNGVTQKLPILTGRPEEWPLFIGMYEASNEACGFTDVENLVRLQECLKGSALESVRGQLLFPKSVSRVISKLRQLYGRPEQLLQCHLEKVRKLKPPNADKLATFIPFGTAVEQLCEHLEVTGLKQHLVNPLLVQNLVDKLPTSNKREWVRYKRRKKTVTLRTLTNFLSRIVAEACEANVSVDFMAEVRSGSAGFVQEEDDAVYNNSAAVTNVQEAGVSTQKACGLCERTDHQLRFCRGFRNMPPEERVKLVRECKLCELCLNDHRNLECKFKMRCNVSGCMQRHNSLLHLRSEHVVMNDHNILFRVLPVTLTFRDQSVTTLALLDEGSSITMVETELADQLGAEGVPQKLEISWTGDVARVEEDSRRISLKISAVGGAQQLLINEVCTVGELALPGQSLDAREMARRYEHLRDIPVTSYKKS
ncbi:uncharacterized protein LOC134289412 [Aedes albopictus]|uniref:Zinc finger PHD-type domain-containing protein n=1 Tax=Aedes albopictus TaxID=7160 RepID=A0ABM1Z033_AEDAL